MNGMLLVVLRHLCVAQNHAQMSHLRLSCVVYSILINFFSLYLLLMDSAADNFIHTSYDSFSLYDAIDRVAIAVFSQVAIH